MSKTRRRTLADLPAPDADTVRKILALLTPVTPAAEAQDPPDENVA